jgi:urease subunit gamma/beta
MPLTPGESDRLLLHTQASLAQRRRDRGLLLNVPEARALIADAVCEWARDGLDLPTTIARARALLGPDDVLPGVTQALTEIRVEARFDDGTRLVVVASPFGEQGEPTSPGRDADVPAATPTLTVTNETGTAIGLTSHVHLAEVNPRLRLDRAAAFGMRPAITTGETVWIRPGERIELAVRPIAGARVAIGTSGVVDGRLDDPGVRGRALSTLRACGYLDVVDGQPVGDAVDAQDAVARLVAQRRAPTP